MVAESPVEIDRRSIFSAVHRDPATFADRIQNLILRNHGRPGGLQKISGLKRHSAPDVQMFLFMQVFVEVHMRTLADKTVKIAETPLLRLCNRRQFELDRVYGRNAALKALLACRLE